jgi:hypothetical protein
MFSWRKKRREEEEDFRPLAVLCSTYSVLWNNEENIENSEALFCDNVPIMIDMTKIVAIQADVEFRSDGTCSVGSRTLAYCIGSETALIIDVPYKTFVETFTLLKSNEIHNDHNKVR